MCEYGCKSVFMYVFMYICFERVLSTYISHIAETDRVSIVGIRITAWVCSPPHRYFVAFGVLSILPRPKP